MCKRDELINFCKDNSRYDDCIGHYVSISPLVALKKRDLTHEEFEVWCTELKAETQSLQSEFPLPPDPYGLMHKTCQNLFNQEYLKYLISVTTLGLPLIVFGDKPPMRFL